MESKMGVGQIQSKREAAKGLSPKEPIDALFLSFRKKHIKEPLDRNSFDLFQQVKQLLLKGYVLDDQSDKEKIWELAGFWSQFDLEDLYNNSDVTGEAVLKYYQNWMLTARVLIKLEVFFKALQCKKSFNHKAFDGVQQIATYLDKQEVEFSLGKQLWGKKGPKYSFNSYSMSKFTQQPSETQTSGQNYSNQIYKLAKDRKIEFVVELFEFLAKIGLLELEGQKTAFENEFMNKLQILKKKDQRELLIKSYSCNYFETLQEMKEQNNEQQLGKGLMVYLPNVYFYKNSKTIRRSGMTMEVLHSHFQNYNFLESVHDYIQWMFPNHYGSAFNSSSAPLNYIESEIFLKDDDIKTSLLYSLYLFTNFMGLKLDEQDMEFRIISERRLSNVILVNYHNHLRIMRIFACLSVVGLREIAVKLIKFLDDHTGEGQLLENERRQFNQNWGIYGDKTMTKAKQMCFLEKQDFPEGSTFLTQFIQHARQVESQFQKEKKLVSQSPQKYSLIKESPQKEKNVVNNKMEVEAPPNQSRLFSQHPAKEEESPDIQDFK